MIFFLLALLVLLVASYLAGLLNESEKRDMIEKNLKLEISHYKCLAEKSQATLDKIESDNARKYFGGLR